MIRIGTDLGLHRREQPEMESRRRWYQANTQHWQSHLTRKKLQSLLDRREQYQ
jgi:hypothetical protein